MWVFSTQVYSSCMNKSIKPGFSFSFSCTMHTFQEYTMFISINLLSSCTRFSTLV